MICPHCGKDTDAPKQPVPNWVMPFVIVIDFMAVMCMVTALWLAFA